MGMVRSISVIFDTISTYSCSFDKGKILNIEEKTFPRNLKGIEKVLEISGFRIVKYSFRSESGHTITLRAQT